MIAEGIDEKQVYMEFMALGKEIKTPVLELYYGLELLKGARVIDRIERTRSHSFNRIAFNWMFSQLSAYPFPDGSFGASYISLKDYTGAIRSDATSPIYGGRNTNNTNIIKIDAPGYGYNGALTIDTRGIVVGTGSGAESFDAWALTTRVLHGNGAGQMHHDDTVAPTVAWDNGTKTMTSTFIRYFNNNSGNTITITEIGIYAYLSAYTCMVTRDLLGAAIDCVDASQLKVTYEIDLIYPE